MKRRVHYAWIITLGCFIVMFYGLGLAFNCISVFLNPLMESIGVSNTLRSSITAFYQSGSVVALIFAGPIIEKYGARKITLLSGLCMAAGYLILAASKKIATCYCAMLIIGIGYGAGAIVPCSLLLTTWFVKKRGFALGLATCGSGVATIFAPTLLTKIIVELNVHNAFIVHGIIIAILAVIAFLLLRDDPEEVGECAYGQDLKDVEENSSGKKVKLSDALKDRNFMMIGAGTIAVGLIISPVVTHMSPIISQSGYDLELAAKVVSVYGIAMLLGKPIYGAIIDKVGIIKSNIYIYFFLLAAMIDGMFVGKSVVLAFGLTVLFGIGGAPIITIGLPIWVAEIFGKESMSSIFAILKLFSSLGGAIGATLPGIIMDRTGAYTDLFKIYIFLIILSFAIIQYLFLKKNRKIQKIKKER